MSSYRGQKKIEKNDPRLQMTGKCESCKKDFKNRQLRTNKGKADEIKVFKMCLDCWRKSRKGGAQKESATNNGVDDSSAMANEVPNDLYLATKDSEGQRIKRPRPRGPRSGQRETAKSLAASRSVPAAIRAPSDGAAEGATTWPATTEDHRGGDDRDDRCHEL